MKTYEKPSMAVKQLVPDTSIAAADLGAGLYEGIVNESAPTTWWGILDN